MVCVPCIIIPVLLYIWHRFIQPILLRYWNPWQEVDAKGNIIKTPPPQNPFECKNGVCAFKPKRKAEIEAAGAPTRPAVENEDNFQDCVTDSAESKSNGSPLGSTGRKSAFAGGRARPALVVEDKKQI